MSKLIIIYHDPCSDGFGAAVAAYDHFRWAERYSDIELHAHKADDDNWELDTLIGNYVLIVDLCPKPEQLVPIANVACALTIIDHHKSSSWIKNYLPVKDGIPGLPPVLWDDQHSASVLVWKALHPTLGDDDVPLLYQYIEDRDLWRWKLEYSEAVSAYLAHIEKSLGDWMDASSLWTKGSKYFNMVVEKGVLISDVKWKEMALILRNQTVVSFHGFQVPAVNSPIHQSELGNVICKDQPFGIVWNFQGGSKPWRYSLRADGSTNSQDVAAIAIQYGGGGHRNASGFSLEKPAF